MAPLPILSCYCINASIYDNHDDNGQASVDVDESSYNNGLGACHISDTHGATRNNTMQVEKQPAKRDNGHELFVDKS